MLTETVSRFRRWSFLLAVLPLIPTGGSSGSLTLVADGVSLAPIVVFQGAPPKTLRAADELADYIEKISGARPTVVGGMPDRMPERAIWVGYQPALDNLFPEIDFDFRHPEEILIAANDNHVVIAGRDRWDPDRMVAQGARQTIQGVQSEYGTINAVYTFLQDYLDVRWLFPGEIGVDVIERDTIRLTPFVYRYHPQIRSRASIFNFSQLGNNQGASHDWVRFQRLQLDSLSVPGGHGFSAWSERFGESHPEFFALQPDGSRGGFGFPNWRNVKMCKSNPELWAQWIRDVERSVEQNPARTVFNAAANDAYNQGYCVCEHCVAWDHPEGEPRRLMWQGIAMEYPALSDRQVTFANQLGRLLKERFPDRDYFVSIMAYGPSRPEPVEARPAANVIIGNVANFIIRPGYLDRDAVREPQPSHREQFKEWARMGALQAWRPNTGNPAGWREGLPDVPIRHVIDSMQFVAEHGAIGIFVDMVWEHWHAQGPLYYVLGQLAWNPNQDAEALLADYYRRGFGPAADRIEAYWTLMENNRSAFFKDARTHQDYSIPPSRWREIYTDALLDDAEALLEAAAAQVADAPQRYRDRVAVVQWGLTYTRLLLDNSDLMRRYRDSDRQDAAAADQVRANWDQILSMRERFPSIKRWPWMNNPEVRPHWRGWHPDNL